MKNSVFYCVAAKVLLAGVALPSATVFGQDIYVANSNSGTIGEYTTSGTVVNDSLISGLYQPDAIAISGSNLFVGSYDGCYVGEYTISGGTVNSRLITGPSNLESLAVSGSNLFVVWANPNENGSVGNGWVGEYTTSGATLNASLLALPNPVAIAVSGSNLFVTESYFNSIGEYTTSGGTVNSSLVTSGLSNPWGLAIYNGNLFVTNENFGGQPNTGTIGEYTTAGDVVNSSLVTGLNAPIGLTVDGSNIFATDYSGSGDIGMISEYTMSGGTVNTALITGIEGNGGIAETVPTPEPSTLVLLAAGLMLFGGYRLRRQTARSWRLTSLARTPTIDDDQADDPNILSFPSQSSRCVAARRAA